LAQLIRARGNLIAASDAFQLVDNVVDFLSLHQSADALEVSVATAEERHILDDVVIIGSHVDKD